MGVLSTARRFGWCKVDKPDAAFFRCTNSCGRNRPFRRHGFTQRGLQDFYGASIEKSAFAREHTISNTALVRLWRRARSGSRVVSTLTPSSCPDRVPSSVVVR